MCSLLFVYGTLRRAANTKWSRLLASMADFAGAGRTRGLLFRVAHYPGMILTAQEDAWVVGEVYSLHEPPNALQVLDEYEGCGPADPPPHPFERQIVDVWFNDHRTVRAWAYTYCFETAPESRIASGDFLEAENSI